MISISVIIPCFNCEESVLKDVKKILSRLKKLKLTFEIILVNDGSTDATLKELELSRRLSKKIKIVSYNINVGKSFAINKAIKKSKYKHIVMIDNNLPYFEALKIVIKKLQENYDLVFVNRRDKKSLIKKRILSLYQIFRFIIGYAISLIIKYKLKFNIKGLDTQAGLKGFKKIKNFNKIKFISKIFFYDLELMYIYYVNRKKFFSVPVKYEVPKKSSIKIFSLNKNIQIVTELVKVVRKLNKLKKNFFD